MNVNDPLRHTAQRELFASVVRVVAGASTDNVIAASLNLLINAVRQTTPNRRDAEARFDELAARAKSLLLDHYDAVTGRRRSVFPFTQTITPPHVKLDDR